MRPAQWHERRLLRTGAPPCAPTSLGFGPGIVRGPEPTSMTPHTDTKFVGRSSELATLTARFEQAVAGNGGVALIAGEPGIGKTRLAHAFADRAERQGTLI